MIRRAVMAGLVLLGAGCATKGAVRRVETQVLVLRAETARQDSVRAAELARIIRLQQAVLDSLTNTRQAIRVLDARNAADVTDLQRQLLAIQELTGQSQRRLAEIRTQMDNRAEALAATAPPPVGDSAGAAPIGGAQPAPSADQMYTGALQQYQRGSTVVARRTFLEFLQQYPTHPNAPDASYWIAESFERTEPDSAIARYGELRTKYPQSRWAPTSLYKIGYVYENVVKDVPKARAAYQRLLNEFPRSEDAELAKARLDGLKP
ncbi:MAG: tol-pal system YbgF family protein [Gemmatimonadales bacterium]